MHASTFQHLKYCGWSRRHWQCFEKQEARISVGLLLRMWSGGVTVGNGEEGAVQYNSLIGASLEEVLCDMPLGMHFQLDKLTP